MQNNPVALIIAHIWITTLMILSGETLLEPLAATWFWAPIISIFLTPTSYDVHQFSRKLGKLYEPYEKTFRAVSWGLSVTLVPWLLWSKLQFLDHTYLHPAREYVGRSIGLDGQTGLVLATTTLVTFLLLVPAIVRALVSIVSAIGRALGENTVPEDE